MTQNEFKEKLNIFVIGLSESETKIVQDTLLFEHGIIDSMKILDLIAFVESNLNMGIPDNMIVLKNFETIDAITKVFYKKDKKIRGKK